MLFKSTLLPATLLCASVIAHAANDAPPSKEKNTAAGISNKIAGKSSSVNYTLHIDNAVNSNNTVDSVLVILDKFDRSGAGIVTKVFYPDASNHFIIEDLPAGKYYAEIYVMGLYKKHFSSVIKAKKSVRNNTANLKLDYSDVYMPGSASIPEENVKLFAYNRN